MSADIYLASNVEGWEPDGTLAERISPTLARATIALTTDEVIEFKVTQGTWQTVQKYSDCSETTNETALASPGFSASQRHRHTVWRFADDGCQ